MAFLSYKTFVWPQNPETYQETISRKAEYHTSGGTTVFDGMGDMKRIITGSGVFSGADACAQFKLLLKLAEESGAGNLEHPVWGIRYCYFTGLELLQEPEDECIHYKFEFTQALENGIVPA